MVIIGMSNNHHVDSGGATSSQVRGDCPFTGIEVTRSRPGVDHNGPSPGGFNNGSITLSNVEKTHAEPFTEGDADGRWHEDSNIQSNEEANKQVFGDAGNVEVEEQKKCHAKRQRVHWKEPGCVRIRKRRSTGIADQPEGAIKEQLVGCSACRSSFARMP